MSTFLFGISRLKWLSLDLLSPCIWFSKSVGGQTRINKCESKPISRKPRPCYRLQPMSSTKRKRGRKSSRGRFNSGVEVMKSDALVHRPDGQYNTATGSYALYANKTGASNTGTGNGALGANTIGDCNVALGGAALAANTSGACDTATGTSALSTNTTGMNNTATGSAALSSNAGG